MSHVEREPMPRKELKHLWVFSLVLGMGIYPVLGVLVLKHQILGPFIQNVDILKTVSTVVFVGLFWYELAIYEAGYNYGYLYKLWHNLYRFVNWIGDCFSKGDARLNESEE